MLVLSFLGKSASAALDSGFSVWSYKVESNQGGSSGAGELAAGFRVALSLRRGVDARGGDRYPGIPQLAGITVQQDAVSGRVHVVRMIDTPGPQTLSFAAPTGESAGDVQLARAPEGQNLAPVQFLVPGVSTPQSVQVLTVPTEGAFVPNGRPAADFRGAYPYATEVFGVYQPLAGWFGRQGSLRALQGLGLAPRPTGAAFYGSDARTLRHEQLAALAEQVTAAAQGVLSPVGVVNLFRQYFFEFDSFLGGPVGHVWLSPGGTVELVETSTRRVLVERTSEQSEEVSRKVEESLTEQDDIADAVKEDNANDTSLGISATGGANAGIYHADASASFSLHTTVHKSSEETHKHSRTQSSKASSEIKRNFKTTFKTVTDTTDTSSRRYVLQNPSTSQLANYELRRKMRKVGVQLQHIGTRLCWQVYLDAPGRDLGVAELVHTVAAPDLSSLKKPEPPAPLETKITEFTGSFPVRKYPGTENDIPPNEDFPFHDDGSDRIISHNRNDHMVATAPFTADPPAPGYTLVHVAVKSAKSGGGDGKFIAEEPITIKDAVHGRFEVIADFLNSGDARVLQLTFSLTWSPPAQNPAQAQYLADKADYDRKVAAIQHQAYGEAVRDRVKLVSAMRPRPSEDLRSEERQTVYGALIRELSLFEDAHLGSELIRQIFDVDEMLYFVAPDYWRPLPVPAPDPLPHPTPATVGRYPVPPPPWATSDPAVLEGQTVGGWYSHTGQDNVVDPLLHATPEWRLNYPITEDSQPAPMGSSLGWLIQIDGDERRSEFLNAAWAKAVLPVRPGHETEALAWLAAADVEGEAALDLPYPFQPGDPTEYQGKKVGEVLGLLAAELQRSNLDFTNGLATERVFETGFDPLQGGFRPPAPYEIFDQWVEVLPTDQVVAVQVAYDPKTGQQL
ncbi:hypothetical protein [Streptomyces sp. NPDC001435]|uniref:hypothetical protein n=1 Tax=unclassified Streptomyces TaxID=2593676 RepID=UPI0036C2A09E